MDRVVTIRDGRTSSETVRQAADVEATLAHGLQNVADDNHLYEEYVVVDAAGRLQIPPDMCERTGIGSRVILEEEEDGIFIRPVAGMQPIITSNNRQDTDSAVKPVELDDQPPSPRRTGLGRWLRRNRG